MSIFFRKKRTLQGMEIEDSIMTATEKEEAVIETPFKRKGVKFIWFLVVLAMFVLAGRVFYLDFVRGAFYSEISKGNRVREIVIKAPRGKIFDKFGKILAQNTPSVDAIVIPSDLPESLAEKQKIAVILAEILNLDKKEIEELIESQDKNSLKPVLIKENITNDQALIISEKTSGLGGVVLEKTAIRNYEESVIFSAIIGYDGKINKKELEENPDYLMTDYIGKSGLEKIYESVLRGHHGARQVEVDSLGNVKKNLGIINPQAGNDLVLNIDEGLQKRIFDSLSSVLEKSGTKTAAAVAIDPRNGGVLAMVSLPAFDNSLFARGISSEEYQSIISNKDLPLFNRVTSGEYPPGSTLKPAVAVAALSEGTINGGTSLNCSGGISIGSWHFGDWKTHGGGIDVKKAIAESCDVFFYAVGGGYGNIPGLGMDRMKKYETLFGFGIVTGIDMPNESNGLIPDENWKQEKIKEKWYIGDSYHAAIGQGYVTATPLQLANYTAAIANGGTLYSPRVVGKIKKMDGTEEMIWSPVIRKNFVSWDVLDVVRQGMRQTVESGTAQSLNSLPIAVAGKTGTAQFGTEDKTHAWFISFAPYDDPEIAMAVLVEGGGEGHSSAVPVTRDVLDWYFKQK
jgi:penicillin-binding protein 2